MAAVHSIKWKLALNMLRAAAESKSVSLGRQWNEKGTGAGNRGRDRRKPSPRDMKSLLTRQQQPSLRHFRSFSAPLPSDPPLPCCFGMSLRRVSCLFSNFNANNFVFFRLPLWQLLPRLPCYPPDYLPAWPVPQQQPLLEKVSAT